MPQDRIAGIMPAGELQRKLQQAARRAQDLKAALGDLKDDLDHMVADPDYADIDAELGTTGQGQTLYNAIAGAYTTMDTDGNFQVLTSRIT